MLFWPFATDAVLLAKELKTDAKFIEGRTRHISTLKAIANNMKGQERDVSV